MPLVVSAKRNVAKSLVTGANSLLKALNPMLMEVVFK